MFLSWRVLLCTLAVLSLIDVRPVNGRKSGGHSYPKSGGLSGGGRHGGYPSSGGLSGGNHGYPSSSGSHGYPSSGGSHGYPSSGGSHGYPSSGGSNGYPSSGGGLSGGGTGQKPGGSHGYPSSGGGLSGGGTGQKPGGNHGYPASGGSHGYPGSGGMSGNSHGYPSKGPAVTTHTTNVHNHYHYTPPQQIRYTPVGGGPPKSYPVYQGTPPTYVYHMRDSGSKYGPLLAGLALLNLGTLAGTAYAHSHSSSKYTPKSGEVCLFGVKKDNGDYEETKIDCQLISSFIMQEEAKPSNATNSSITTTTVTNVTMVNITNGVPQAAPSSTPVPGNPIYAMLPNGTLVPLNATSANSTANATTAESSPNNTMTSSVTITTTTTNTTATNALDVKGKAIAVTPGMQCFMIRTTPTSRMRKAVSCGLLQTYADKSFKKNSAARNGPAVMILSIVLALSFVY